MVCGGRRCLKFFGVYAETGSSWSIRTCANAAGWRTDLSGSVNSGAFNFLEEVSKVGCAGKKDTGVK